MNKNTIHFLELLDIRYLKLVFFLYILNLNPLSFNDIQAQTSINFIENNVNRYSEDNIIGFNQGDDIHNLNYNIKTLANPDSMNIRTVGRWADGPCYSVDTKNNIAYFGNGAYLQAVDFSKLSDPKEIQKILLQAVVNDVVVNGNYVYVGTCGGFNIIDISVPDNPKFIKSVIHIDCHGIMIRDNYAYIADYGGQGGPPGLKIFDITVPEEANVIGTFPTESINHNVFVDKNYAFLANDTHGLQIVNVSQPNSPIFVVNIPSKDETHGVAVYDHYVFMADGTAGVRIFDISNIDEPKEIQQLLLGFDSENALNVKIQSSYAFATYAYSPVGLAKFDISDPSDPQLINKYSTDARSTFDVSAHGDNLYAACHCDLLVIDSSDAKSPNQFIYETGGAPNDVAIEGNHAILSNLQIIDISDPENPFEISESHSLDWGLCINIKNNYAYVGQNNGLEIVDISDFIKPKSALSVAIPGICRNVVLNGNYAYVAAGIAGLWVLDISNPLNPLILDSCKTGEEAYGVFIKNNIAYVADNDSGLYVINISDPYNLNILKHYYNGWGALDLAFVGNYAYIIADNYKLYVIDITDPVNPIEKGSYYIGWNWGTADIKVDHNYLYVSGLLIYNISNPLYPLEVGHYSTWDYLHGLCIKDNYIYTVMNNAGIYILEYLRYPKIEVSSSNVDFGNIKIREFKDISIQISSSNIEADTLRITSLGIDSEVFVLPSEKTSFAIPYSESINLKIRFSPTRIGNFIGELKIVNNSVNNPTTTVVLNGNCVDQVLAVLPNPFSPNNDGYNDYVEFKFPSMFTKTSEIFIFDVSGKKITTLDNSNGKNYKWYGINDRGDPLEPGVYIFIIKIDGSSKYNGTVALIR